MAILTLAFATISTPVAPSAAAAAPAVTAADQPRYFNQTDIDAINDVNFALDNFFDAYNTSGENYSDVISAAETFKAALATARARIGYYNTDSDYLAAVGEVHAAIDAWTSAAENLKTAVATGDDAQIFQAETALNNQADQWNAALDAYDAMIDNYSKDPLKSGDAMYAFWHILLVISVMCLVAAIAMAFLTRNQQGEATGKNGKIISLKDARRHIVGGAVLLVVGAAIPAAQYWWGVNHPNSDGSFTYSVFWYPLIFSVIILISGIFQYLATYKAAKKSGQLFHSDNATEIALNNTPKPTGE
jgi:hypothetical protein